MQLLSVFTLLLAGIITIAAAANSDQYVVMSKFKSGMQAGHAYAFKSGPIFGHQRLIIARVTGVPGNLDLSAEMFQIYADEDGKFQKNNPEWQCEAGGKYRYKAEVDPGLTFMDIDIKGQVLLLGNTEYRLLTNNCIQHINTLLTRIKTRQEYEERLRARENRIAARGTVEALGFD